MPLRIYNNQANLPKLIGRNLYSFLTFFNENLRGAVLLIKLNNKIQCSKFGSKLNC